MFESIYIAFFLVVENSKDLADSSSSSSRFIVGQAGEKDGNKTVGWGGNGEFVSLSETEERRRRKKEKVAQQIVSCFRVASSVHYFVRHF